MVPNRGAVRWLQFLDLHTKPTRCATKHLQYLSKGAENKKRLENTALINLFFFGNRYRVWRYSTYDRLTFPIHQLQSKNDKSERISIDGQNRNNRNINVKITVTFHDMTNWRLRHSSIFVGNKMRNWLASQKKAESYFPQFWHQF